MELYMKDSPCHHCDKRFPACHGSCADFKEWRAPLDKMSEDKAKKRITDEVASNGRQRRYRETRRYNTDKNIGGFRR